VYADALGDLSLYEMAHQQLDVAETLATAKVLPFVLNKRGDTYEKMGRFDLAVKMHARACHRDPANAGHPIYACTNACEMGDLRQAIGWAEKACECTTGAVDEGYYNLGVIQMVERRYAEAHGCFARAVEMDPEYTSAKDRLKELEEITRLQERYPL
jgi:tetratricopeptide (TPR) repeat protein